jgi:hypothetical protein
MAADVWASGPSGSYHFNGTWTRFFIGSNSLPLNAIRGISRTNIVGVGDNGLIAHYDGSHWNTDVLKGTDPTLSLYSVGGTGPDDLWAGGTDRFMRFDGASWTNVPFVIPSPVNPINYRGLWLYQRAQGFACSDTYSVISQLNAGTWSKRSTSGSNHELFDMWGSDLAHAWAVGHGHDLTVGAPAKIMKWDGTTWTDDSTVPASLPVLRAVWGTDATHVWAVGDNGTILFFDGSTWMARFSGTSDNLNAIWGSGPRDIWVAGSGGARHFNGTAWSAVGAVGALTTIWLSAD